MKDLKIFDESGKALHMADVISRFTKFKIYGTSTDGSIFYIDEEKLNQDHINQIRNYLNSKEKKLLKVKMFNRSTSAPLHKSK